MRCCGLPAGEERLVNAIGGCCGTSPEHIAAIREMASAYTPREKHSVKPLMRLSGLEALNYDPDVNDMRKTFLNIGERCNVAGSIIYKKAIVDGDYDKAVSIALSQVGVVQGGLWAGGRAGGLAGGRAGWLAGWPHVPPVVRRPPCKRCQLRVPLYDGKD